jgi:hypothetical protein
MPPIEIRGRRVKDRNTDEGGGGSEYKVGWLVDSTNIGLVGAGIDRSTLAVYSGPVEVPAGTTISLKRINSALDLTDGNITIDRCWIRPSTVPGWSFGAFVQSWRSSGGTYDGNNVITDCEIDGDHLSLTLPLAQACGFAGPAVNMYRNYIHGMGTGIAIFGADAATNTIENNYVTGLRATGDSHNEAATVREHEDGTLLWRGNRLNCDVVGHTSAQMFIQTYAGQVNNVTLEDTYTEGPGFHIYLERYLGSGPTYSNIRVINTRYRGYGEYYGPESVANGAGYAQYTGNYTWANTPPLYQGAPA